MASESVRSYLRTHNATSASELAAYFQEEKNVSYEAARKRIQRAKREEDICTLGPISLPHNGSVLYLDENYNHPDFWESLLETLEEAGSSYAWSIRSLLARGGLTSHRRFALISGRPRRMKGQISAERSLANLEEIGLIDRSPSGENGSQEHISVCPEAQFLAGSTPGNTREGYLRARHVAEEVLLKGIKQWARNLGLVSYNSVEIISSDTVPQFGPFDWCLTAPSYAHPLVSFEGDEDPDPGFVVADVLLGKELTPAEIRYFVEKCQMIRSQTSIRPFMGMLVASGFTRDALRVGRSNGLLFTTPENLFGDQVAEGLRQVIQTITNAGAVAVNEPERIGELFDKLSRIEGAAQSMRGPLFELAVAHCVKKREGEYVDLGRQVTDPHRGENTEIDVLVGRTGSAIECKGVAPGGYVSQETVKDWVTRQVPRIRQWMISQDEYPSQDQQFELWTTGTFSEAAVDYLDERRQAIGNYTIDYKTGAEVRAYASSIGLPGADHIVEVLDEHFLDTPHPEPSTSKNEGPNAEPVSSTA